MSRQSWSWCSRYSLRRAREPEAYWPFVTLAPSSKPERLPSAGNSDTTELPHPFALRRLKGPHPSCTPILSNRNARRDFHPEIYSQLTQTSSRISRFKHIGSLKSRRYRINIVISKSFAFFFYLLISNFIKENVCQAIFLYIQ